MSFWSAWIGPKRRRGTSGAALWIGVTRGGEQIDDTEVDDGLHSGVLWLLCGRNDIGTIISFLELLMNVKQTQLSLTAIIDLHTE